MRNNTRERDKGDESDWEDIPEVKLSSPLTTSSMRSERTSPVPSLNTATRKRRAGSAARTVYIANPRRTTTQPRAKPAKHTTQPLLTEDEMHAAVTQSVRLSAIYVHDVLGSFFRYLKKPLSILLVIWAIAVFINSLSASIKSAVSPLCFLPGLSRSSLCITPQYGQPSEDGQERIMARHADYPKMVEIQSKTFEQLLDESVGGSGLSLEIKKAEMATRDLVTLVRVSKLTSKDLLANALIDFVEDARNTARGLQRLSAKVNGAVDNIMAINDYALRTIESGGADKLSIMDVIWPFSDSSKPTSQEILSSTFAQSLSVLSDSLAKLIVMAEASLHELDKLEARLGTIHSVIAREDSSITAQKSELLAELWTRLGGNRAQMHSFNNNLQLLRELGNYRTRALAHVVAALQALQTLSADMEELRERVAAPELAGGEIPIEVHARSIRSGIERLNEGRIRAKQREEEAVERILGVESG